MDKSQSSQRLCSLRAGEAGCLPGLLAQTYTPGQSHFSPGARTARPPSPSDLRLQTRPAVRGRKATAPERDTQAARVTHSLAKIGTVLNPNNPK